MLNLDRLVYLLGVILARTVFYGLGLLPALVITAFLVWVYRESGIEALVFMSAIVFAVIAILHEVIRALKESP